MATSISSELSVGRKCSFCPCQSAGYVCPRCNFPYCSSDCYKSAQHAKCSELFYREWVETHLRNTGNSSDTRRQVANILRRVYQSDEALDSDDDDNMPELSERLSEIDLEGITGNENEIWDKLTDTEKQEFENLITRGDCHSILPLWEPWWRFKGKIKLVQEIGEETQPNPLLMKHPQIRENIPPLKSLISVPVYPNLKYNFVNVLYAYAYVVSFYNGDHYEFPLESMENVLKLSTCLNENRNFSDVVEAITNVNLALQQNEELANSQSFVVGIIDDVKRILEGPGGDEKPPQTYILAALADLEKLAQDARKIIKMDPSSKLNTSISDSSQSLRNASSGKELISKFRHVERKLVFYMSWIEDRHQELLPAMAELDLFYECKLQELVLFEKQKTELDNSRKKEASKAPKIQEL